MQFIVFLNEVLFLTNAWILIYNNLLRFLNIHFPQSAPVGFIREGAVPEPFEILLYLTLSVLTIIAIWFYHHKTKSSLFFHNKHQTLTNIAVLIFLTILFFINIGSYPMARSIYPYQQAETVSTYWIFFINYIAVVILFAAEAAIASRFIAKYKIAFRVFAFFILLIIAIASFEPRFPILAHDYSYFLGPIWEVVHGKTLYTQVASQYGFLSVLFFALIYKLHIFNPFYLPAFIWILYIIEYFLCFFIIYKISKSPTLSILGLFSIITLNYFSLYHLPASIPQIGPLRWLPLIISAFVLLRVKQIDSKKFILVLAFSCFWVIDSGISLILAYVFTLVFLTFTRTLSFKKAIMAGIYLSLTMIVVFLIINVLHIFFGYHAIDIFALFGKFSQYAKAGFGMLPMDPKTYFWVVLVVYFSSMIYFFKNKSLPYGQDNVLSLLVFCANLSLFACAYFVGRSHVHNLFHIAIFPLLNLFILISLVLKDLTNKQKAVIFSTILFFLIIFPIYNRQEVMAKMILTKIKKYQEGNIFTPEAKTILEKKYKEEVNLINTNLPQKKILILSSDDTYLFYLTKKENLMNDNSQYTILTENDLEKSLKFTTSSCPQKIAGDCRLFKKCTVNNPFTEIVSFSIQPLLLGKIENTCGVKYQADQCTNQLCIAHPETK